MTATEMFEKTYKKPAAYTAFTPYRICPIGAHSDHQLGKITGFAINKGIHIAYGPKENGRKKSSMARFRNPRHSSARLG